MVTVKVTNSSEINVELSVVVRKCTFQKKIKLGHSKQNNKYLHKLEVTRLTQVTF